MTQLRSSTPAASKKNVLRAEPEPGRAAPSVQRSRPRSVPRSLSGLAVTEEERWQMVQTAAYFRAEQRGFEGGNPDQDWFEAESDVDRMLGRRI